ncbi:MAG: radical SAM protein [Desulfobaccales bacterium]
MLLTPEEMPAVAPKDQPKGSLASRTWQMIRHNPGMLHSVLREEYRRRWGISLDRRYRQGLSSPPVSLSLNLTRRCNLKCRMCEQHRHQSRSSTALSWYDPGRELPVAAWQDLLDQVAYFRPRLYLTGGEPLLYPHFPELIREAKKRKFLLHLQTNGTLLDRAADLLVDAGVEMVTVSLDGPAAIHDRVRGLKGAFRRTQEGIAALLAARGNRAAPLVLINCVISKANFSILEEMAPLALKMGADILQLQHTIFNAPDNVERHNRWLSREFVQTQGLDLVTPSIPTGEFYESEITGEDLPRLRAGLEEARRLAHGRLRLQFLPNLPAELLASYYLDLNHPFPQVCQDLWKGCRILPDGTVSPCLHLVAGNITQRPFREIWNGPQMQRFRRLISSRLFPGCARCCSRSFT